MEAPLQFEAFPSRSLSVKLFTDVTNGGEIKQGIISGSHAVEAAFVNAALVPDLFVLHLAAMKVLLAEARGKLRTHSLHSELVYNTSGSKHISETLKRWGVSEGTPKLLVARFDATAEEWAAVSELVKGTEVSLDTLGRLADSAQIKKAYKLSQDELKIGGETDAIAMRIAARDC
uniref:EKC/KEOPS complex subunit CGI121 n=1 Tax=Tetraselmis chuii TaxID=63592 RepID=A0A6U1JQL4_9CHLO|mmetsp:Transcript_38985/g.69855  ORF Transcript_38985/g.69855 Transcript_38985/m.69855 type:complete len:175 (+) Transcript_38985:293-817(+)|eukprot:CAMPEP_0177770440 /NCGR_PEP_ID=MMETSP0491_2-20121128/10927_1 /TAXON_ID=63592 /ORGANISM="Tetraselmis chuii, Strain PLY429" /LENGTH=174 /DNA_ID=CAMNT_0019287657 /DNA_START=183 /DNA_END=707 /DNA_ORIENTATION=+